MKRNLALLLFVALAAAPAILFHRSEKAAAANTAAAPARPAVSDESCPKVVVYGGGEGPKPLVLVFPGEGPKPLSFTYGGQPKTAYAVEDRKPTDLPPGSGPPVKEVLDKQLETGRILFKGGGNHKVFVRVARNADSAHRKCSVTLLDRPVVPSTFSPYIDLFGAGPLPSAWVELPPQEKDKYYLLDGLKMSLHGHWTLAPRTQVTKWELGNGYHYRLGYLDAGMPHPIYPPGEFVIEAVVVMYYRREVKEKYSAEPVEITESMTSETKSGK